MQMTLISPDGREEWIATGEEECRELALAGWAPREHFQGERLPRDSGVPGQLLARLSSTTEARRLASGNPGGSSDLSQLDDDELLQELKRRRAAKAEADQAQAEAEAEREREQAAAAKKQADDKAKAEAANAARAKADEKNTPDPKAKSTS